MIRAIVVDDERLALDRLSKLLKGSGAVDVIGAYDYPEDALEALSCGPVGAVDVAFLDIDMPGLGGLALADKILQVDSAVSVVFVTAHNEFAIEAFELNALDYLLKPVRQERLQKTLARVMNQPKAPSEQRILHVACFGEFKVFTGLDEGTEIRWRTSKAEELFAFLVHHRGVAMSRGEIIDTVWPDMLLDKAVTYFHTTLYYIRKTLNNVGIEDCIIQDKGFYKVDISKIRCDYYEFERLTDTTRPLAAADDITSLQNIAVKYRGEYLRGSGYPWVEATRVDLEQRYVALLSQLHDAYLSRGRLQDAADVLQHALRCDPLNERIHEKLIRVYLLMNDGLAAMKQYDALHRKLKREYGVEPADSVKCLLGVK